MHKVGVLRWDAPKDAHHIVLRPGETGITTVHLFRFRGDKIVEMWDWGQTVPADSPNKDGAF